MNNLTIDEKIEKALNDIRPSLQADGGDIEYVGMEGMKVKVRLLGLCSTCPSSMFTLTMGVENHIKDNIPEIEGIISV